MWLNSTALMDKRETETGMDDEAVAWSVVERIHCISMDRTDSHYK